MKIGSAKNYKQEVISLLKSAGLPKDDLPETLDNFVAVFDDEEIIGVAGIELYGKYALVRSVAVSANHREKGIAGRLLKVIEKLAIEKQVSTIYLLTETASGYFNSKGYQALDRSEVPAAIKQSSEFSHVCPVSAVVMKKNLN